MQVEQLNSGYCGNDGVCRQEIEVLCWYNSSRFCIKIFLLL